MHARIPFVSVVAATLLLATAILGQTGARPHARIPQPIDEEKSLTLAGNVHPLGDSSKSAPIAESTPMEHMILFLKGDASQEAKLAQLVLEQNDPKSPLYHRYLTPQEFGSQFGVATTDLDKLTAWLKTMGSALNPHRQAIVRLFSAERRGKYWLRSRPIFDVIR